MPANLDGQLVVAISSRALFDFEEENQFFEDGDDRAYMQLQQQRLDIPAKPGVAFSLVRKLLGFNTAAGPRVEVVVLSRNDPISGMRVFRSAQHYGLKIERGVFTRGESPWRYLRPLKAQLFLSANEADVRSALAAGVAAARVLPLSAHASDAHPHELRIAFDGDAVLFSDEAERVFQAGGLDAFQAHERERVLTPLAAGPFKPVLAALHGLQQDKTDAMTVRTALVTARSAPGGKPWGSSLPSCIAEHIFGDGRPDPQPLLTLSRSAVPSRARRAPTGRRGAAQLDGGGHLAGAAADRPDGRDRTGGAAAPHSTEHLGQVRFRRRRLAQRAQVDHVCLL
ncbi:5'-nucleotidase [Paucibacter sp. XJ19-41]|uniref:5'-nucleotidase n=1 Tax=Paucibacter sp. XJ19-41 TaxID=2927824 RepID=UPI00234BA216|nr:5'-nucleotidase [Paucibacter sp. XJ19-41]MDC6166026.1 5'-nucleotidase [Paucibacter sp. XJ19-41]